MRYVRNNSSNTIISLYINYHYISVEYNNIVKEIVWC